MCIYAMVAKAQKKRCATNGCRLKSRDPGFFRHAQYRPPLTTRDRGLTRLEAGRQAARVLEAEAGKTVFYGVIGGLTSDPRQIAEMVAAYRETAGGWLVLKCSQAIPPEVWGLSSMLSSSWSIRPLPPLDTGCACRAL